MTDKLLEQLSALVDDELDEAEQALLIRQVGRDRQLHQQFVRYQLISDAMKNHLPEQVDMGFGQRVHEVLRREPPAQGGMTTRRLAGLLRPVAGLAVAASVAVVAVTALQNNQDDTGGAPPAVATAPATADFIRDPDSSLAVAPDPVPRIDSSKLDVYLVNHNEYAASHGMQGMLPYMRIVGHDMRRELKD